MKTIFFFVCIILIFFYSCKKKGGGDFYSEVQIHYVDSAGNDLFTNGLNGYYKDSVNVYDFENNIKTPLPIASQSAYFAPYANSTIIISGIINNDVVNQYTNNIIHLKKGVDDTIRIHLNSNQQYGALYDVVWYNGVLKQNVSGISDTFTIKK